MLQLEFYTLFHCAVQQCNKIVLKQVREQQVAYWYPAGSSTVIFSHTNYMVRQKYTCDIFHTSKSAKIVFIYLWNFYVEVGNVGKHDSIFRDDCSWKAADSRITLHAVLVGRICKCYCIQLSTFTRKVLINLTSNLVIQIQANQATAFQHHAFTRTFYSFAYIASKKTTRTNKYIPTNNLSWRVITNRILHHFLHQLFSFSFPNRL